MLDRVLLHGRAEIGQHKGISAHQRKRCRRQRDGCHMSMSRRTLSVARRQHAARSQYRPLRQLPCSAAAAAAADSSCDTLQLLSPCMELLRRRLQGVNESCQCCEWRAKVKNPSTLSFAPTPRTTPQVQQRTREGHPRRPPSVLGIFPMDPATHPSTRRAGPSAPRDGRRRIWLRVSDFQGSRLDPDV